MLTSWGFFAHEHINRLAIFTLPDQLIFFYKENQDYIIKNATSPDKRRYIDTLEAPRHYLDVELYERDIDSIPHSYTNALEKYGIKKLNRNGIVPWQIQKSLSQLTFAFKNRDAGLILKYSSELAHYIGDAHVPLHTTHNHNGQLTNQHGIHGFWESRIPELFFQKYNLVVGKAEYVFNTQLEAWNIVKKAHKLVDSVLVLEKELDQSFPQDKKFTYSKRKNNVIKQYSEAYCTAYQQKSNNITERQFRASIKSIGNYWFTAWVNAGQPDMKNIKYISNEEKTFKKKKVLSKTSDSTFITKEI